jgi:hypothetical protein
MFKFLVPVGLAAAAALALAPLTAQGSSGTSYSLTATSYSESCVSSDFGCLGSFRYIWTGSAACATNCAGEPASGTFTIDLSGSGLLFPPDPCVVKDVSGSLQVSHPPSPVFPTPTFTTVSNLTGESRDGKSYALSGTVDASSTQFPSALMKGLVRFPPNPCASSTTSFPAGDMTFIPPNPV